MNVSGDGGGSNQDFDLNLAPIIDCFTVLITYLLVSASFLTLNVFDVGISMTGEAPPGALVGPPPYSLTAQIKLDHNLAFKVGGGPKNVDITFDIPRTTGGDTDYDLAKQKLGEIRRQYPSLTELSLSAEADVPYKALVKTIDTLHESIDKIYLSE